MTPMTKQTIQSTIALLELSNVPKEALRAITSLLIVQGEIVDMSAAFTDEHYHGASAQAVKQFNDGMVKVVRDAAKNLRDN